MVEVWGAFVGFLGCVGDRDAQLAPLHQRETKHLLEQSISSYYSKAH